MEGSLTCRRSRRRDYRLHRLVYLTFTKRMPLNSFVSTTAKKVKQPRLPSELLPGAPLPPKCEFAFEQQPLHSGQKSQMIKAILAWPNFEDGLDYLVPHLFFFLSLNTRVCQQTGKVGGGYVPVDNLMFWRPDSAGNYSEVTKVYSAPRKSSILCMEVRISFHTCLIGSHLFIIQAAR